MLRHVILKDMEKWQNLNKSKFFSAYDYIFHNMGDRGKSTDIYFALLEMYWPEFIKHEGYIFLKAQFSAEKFEHLKSQNEEIELWMNFLLISPYFENDAAPDEKAAFFAQKLTEIWQVKLKHDFPEIECVVKYLEDTDTGDHGLSFYQQVQQIS